MWSVASVRECHILSLGPGFFREVALASPVLQKVHGPQWPFALEWSTCGTQMAAIAASTSGEKRIGSGI
jgi:hypothetical protein